MQNHPYPSKSLTTKILLTLVFLCLAGTAQLRIADQQSATYINQTLKNSLLTFAVARGLNGVISVAQGTKLAIEPAGVGVSFAVGEVLDPINDLIERFSWVMLASSTSLGIQAILLELSGTQVVTLLVVAISLLMAAMVWLPPQTHSTKRSLVTRGLVLLCFIRFSVIAMVLITHQLSVAFLDEKIAASTEILQQTTLQIQEVEASENNPDHKADPPATLIKRLQQAFDDVTTTFDANKKLARYKQATANAVGHIIELAALFIVQTLLIPLVFFWGMIKMLRYLGSL